ncbi:MAG: hypothetical protein KF687_09550 [Cyclobacteriaceae bacterium]|nr:hypothetical protein [Cyclobacteriaceae bacterium]
MISRLLLATGICVSTVITTFAFENFEKGFVILHNQDTIIGFIDNQMWEDSPTKINFRKSLDDPIVEYTANEVLYFYLNENKELYLGVSLKFRLRHNPLRNTLSYDIAHLEPQPFKGFLSVLVLGKVNLLKISLNEIGYFFIQSENQALIQLELRTIAQDVNGVTYKKDLHLYRNELKILTEEYQLLQKRASTINYGEKSFMSFVVDYNEHFKSLSYKKSKSPKYYTSAGLTVNLLSTSLKFKDNDVGIGAKWVDANALSPSFGAYFIVYQNRGQGKWGFYNEIIYKTLQDNLSYRFIQGVFDYDSETEVQLNRLKYLFGLRVSTTKSKKSSFYGQGGIYISYPIQKDEVVRNIVRDSDVFPLTTKQVSTLEHYGLFVGIGFRVKNIEVEGRAEVNSGGSSTPMKGFGITTRYRLTKQ